MSHKLKRKLVVAKGQSDFLALPYFRGESLSGWVDATAAVTGASKLKLLTFLGIGNAIGMGNDLEKVLASDERVNSIVCDIVDPSTRDNKSDLVQLTPERLLTRACYSFCPLCMSRDIKLEYWPYFRSRWMWPYLTHCETHLTPLYMWPHEPSRTPAGQRHYPDSWVNSYISGHFSYKSWGSDAFSSCLQHARRIRAEFWNDSLISRRWRIQIQLERDIGVIFGLSQQESAMYPSMGSRECLISAVSDLSALASVRVDYGDSETLAKRCGWTDGAQCQYAHPNRTLYLPPRWATPFEALGLCHPLQNMAAPSTRRCVLSVVWQLLAMFWQRGQYSNPRSFGDSGGQLWSELNRDVIPKIIRDWVQERAEKWPKWLARGFKEMTGINDDGPYLRQINNGPVSQFNVRQFLTNCR